MLRFQDMPRLWDSPQGTHPRERLCVLQVAWAGRVEIGKPIGGRPVASRALETGHRTKRVDVFPAWFQSSCCWIFPSCGPISPRWNGNVDSGTLHCKISQWRDYLESPKRVHEVQRSQHLRTLETPDLVSCKKDRQGSVAEAPEFISEHWTWCRMLIPKSS